MRAASANGARINRATWFRRIRIARHLTQAQVAKTVGISTNQISRYERARDDPSLEVFDRLLVALECWYIDMLADTAGSPPPRRPICRPIIDVATRSIQVVIEEFAHPTRPPEQYPDKFRCFSCHGRPGECQCYFICKVCGLPYRREARCSGVLHHRASRAVPRGIAH
jgi:transcriptional regulator with XRE-family HTH domain